MVISVSRSKQNRNPRRNLVIVILDPNLKGQKCHLATNPDIDLNSDAIPKEEILVSRKSFYISDWGEWANQK